MSYQDQARILHDKLQKAALGSGQQDTGFGYAGEGLASQIAGACKQESIREVHQVINDLDRATKRLEAAVAALDRRTQDVQVSQPEKASGAPTRPQPYSPLAQALATATATIEEQAGRLESLEMCIQL